MHESSFRQLEKKPAFTMTVALVIPRKRRKGDTEGQSLATKIACMRAVTVRSKWTAIADKAGTLDTCDLS